jgi:hypothetical protein
MCRQDEGSPLLQQAFRRTRYPAGSVRSSGIVSEPRLTQRSVARTPQLPIPTPRVPIQWRSAYKEIVPFPVIPREGAETRWSPDLPIPVNSSRKSKHRELVRSVGSRYSCFGQASRHIVPTDSSCLLRAGRLWGRYGSELFSMSRNCVASDRDSPASAVRGNAAADSARSSDAEIVGKFPRSQAGGWDRDQVARIHKRVEAPASLRRRLARSRVDHVFAEDRALGAAATRSKRSRVITLPRSQALFGTAPPRGSCLDSALCRSGPDGCVLADLLVALCRLSNLVDDCQHRGR